jgi:hypothetical protein
MENIARGNGLSSGEGIRDVMPTGPIEEQPRLSDQQMIEESIKYLQGKGFDVCF